MSKKNVKGFRPRGNGFQIDTTYSGIRIQETAATEAMAEKVLRRRKTLIDEGRYLDVKKRSNKTLAQIQKGYMDHCQTLGQKDLAGKRRRVVHFVNYLGKDFLLCDVSLEDIDRYRAARRQEGVVSSTINRDMKAVRNMFTWAQDMDYIQDHPCRKLKPLKEANTDYRWLSAEEVRALHNAASAYLKPIIILSVNTGLRRGEVLGIKWNHIDWDRKQLLLLDQKNGKQDHVPLNEEALSALKSVPPRIDNDHVFAYGRGTGKPPPHKLNRDFIQAVTDSGIEHCTHRDLRHTFASHLMKEGVLPLRVQEQMRHSTLAMTQRYAHLFPEEGDRSVDKLSFMGSEAESEGVVGG